MKLAALGTILAALAAQALAQEIKPSTKLSITLMPGVVTSFDGGITSGKDPVMANLVPLEAGGEVVKDVSVGSKKWKCSFTSEAKQERTAMFVLTAPLTAADDKLLDKTEDQGIKAECVVQSGSGGGSGEGDKGNAPPSAEMSATSTTAEPPASAEASPTATIDEAPSPVVVTAEEKPTDP